MSSKMDFEKRTVENLLLFYSEELRALQNGQRASKLFGVHLVKKMVKLGILTFNPKVSRSHILTPQALKYLEAE